MTLSLSSLRARIEVLEQEKQAELDRLYDPFFRFLIDDDLRLLANSQVSVNVRCYWLFSLCQIVEVEKNVITAKRLYRGGKVKLSLANLTARIEALEKREIPKGFLVHYVDENRTYCDDCLIDNGLLGSPDITVIHVSYDGGYQAFDTLGAEKMVILPLKSPVEQVIEPEPVEILPEEAVSTTQASEVIEPKKARRKKRLREGCSHSNQRKPAIFEVSKTLGRKKIIISKEEF